MAHSFVKIAVHLVFSTKNREPTISLGIKHNIHRILEQELQYLNCQVIAINGMPDHVHILFLLNAQKSIADVVKQIKGASSHKINQDSITITKFAWQIGYGAFAVSENRIEKTKIYIANQEIHHQDMNYQIELNRFAEVHGLLTNG
jgi:REP element-mobilizing transposase RayT